jgi:hypothetical protein
VYTWQPIYPIFGVSNRLQPETGFKPVATDFPIAVAHCYTWRVVRAYHRDFEADGPQRWPGL